MAVVFPACAGMFRGTTVSRARPHSFPRVRGDVPIWCRSMSWMPPFSPRARGCSCEKFLAGNDPLVFPACAGMFRRVFCYHGGNGGFPRVRGDVPCFSIMKPGARWFSPRARGCSRHAVCPRGRTRVFPACAGMFLGVEHAWGRDQCFPRVRGDVPPSSVSAPPMGKFSPRARGCSQAVIDSMAARGVFPACAGMFQRGIFIGRNLTVFSPRARGCSFRY